MSLLQEPSEVLLSDSFAASDTANSAERSVTICGLSIEACLVSQLVETMGCYRLPAVHRLKPFIQNGKTKLSQIKAFYDNLARYSLSSIKINY